MDNIKIVKMAKKMAFFKKLSFTCFLVYVVVLLLTIIGACGLPIAFTLAGVIGIPFIPISLVDLVYLLHANELSYSIDIVKESDNNYYQFYSLDDYAYGRKPRTYHLSKNFEITSIDNEEKFINQQELENSFEESENSEEKSLEAKVFTNDEEFDLSDIFDIIDTIDTKDNKPKIRKSNRKTSTKKEDVETQKHLIDESTGREQEIQNLIQALALMNKSAIIVGEPGVGKTALVNGLEYKIQHNDVPDFLKNKKIYRKNAADLIANTMLAGSLEAKVLKLINKIKGKDTILFIDEIHNLIGGGRTMDSTIDIANILKPYLSSGEIKLIGATTEEEYNKYVLNDAAFSRRFEKIVVKEPDNNTLKKIINVQISNNEKKYNIKFDFNDLEKRAIIDVLIELTDKKNRNYNDFKYNPALVLSILEKSFANALCTNGKSVSKENIVNAVKSCNDLYETSRERISIDLNNELSKEKSKTKCKVIDLNDYYKNKGNR